MVKNADMITAEILVAEGAGDPLQRSVSQKQSMNSVKNKFAWSHLRKKTQTLSESSFSLNDCRSEIGQLQLSVLDEMTFFSIFSLVGI